MDTYTERLIEKIAGVEMEPEAVAANGHTNGNGRAKPGGEVLPVVSYDVLAARPREPMGFLIVSILPAGEAVLISGRERSYKSFLTMEMALSVALGQSYLGTYTVPEPRKALMFDLENRRARLCDRVDASLARRGLTHADLGGRLLVFDRDNAPQRWRLEARGLDTLQRTLEVFQPDLVVIDNIRKATPAGKDEREGKDMLPIMDTVVEICESRGISLVLAHHDRRDGTGTSGSGVLLSTPGNVIQINNDRKTRITTVRCDSMRNAEPFDTFAVVMGQNGVLTRTEVPEGADDAVADCGGAVLDALSTGGKTVKEVVAATSLSTPVVRGVIQRLVATQAVMEIGTREADGAGKPAKVYARVFRVN